MWFYLTLATASAAGCTAYLTNLYNRLGSQVHHTSSHGILLPSTIDGTGNGAVITSIPADALNGEHRMVIDSAWKSIPTSSLKSASNAESEGEMLNSYLRHTMLAFTRLPQAPMIRLMCSADERHTFSTAHISKLDFQVGDVVNGGYTVARREQGKVEFAMKPMGTTQGRLVVSLHKQKTEGDGTSLVFRTDTLAWKRVDDKSKIHLEVFPVQQLHEMTSWWLISEGIRSLTS